MLAIFDCSSTVLGINEQAVLAMSGQVFSWVFLRGFIRNILADISQFLIGGRAGREDEKQS